MAGDLNTRIIISANDQASRVFLQTADNLKVVAQGAEKVSSALGGAMSTEVIARQTAELAGNLSRVSAVASLAGKDLRGLGDNFKALAAQTGLPEKEFARLQERMLKTQAARAQAESLRAVGEAAGLSSRELHNLGRQMGMTEGQIQSAAGGIRSAAKTIQTALAAIGLGLGISEAVQGVKSLVGLNSEMESLRKSFEGIFGTQVGAKQFEYVTETANRYGKALDTVADSYRKFAAATDYVGMSAADTKKIFESVTQAISKVGGSSQDVQGTLTALQQMISKGTVSAEEFRLQFAERIPGAMKMGADALGVTTSKFRQMMEAGEIASADFLPKLSVQLDKFSTGWEKAADTVAANSARIANDLKLLAENKYVQKFANESIKVADGLVIALDKGVRAWGDLTEARKLKSLGLLEKGGTWADAQRFIETFDRMDDGEKLGVYRKRLSDIRAEMERLKADPLFGLSGGNGRYWESAPTTQYNGLASQAGELAKIVNQGDYIAKLKGQIEDTKRLAEKGFEVQANTEKVEWLSKLLSDITKTPFVVRVDTQVNTDTLRSALGLIERLYSSSDQFKLSTAQNQLKTLSNPALSTSLQEKLESTREFMVHATGKDFEIASAEVDRLQEAIKNLPGAVFEAKQNAEQAQKASTTAQHRRMDPYFGTNPGEFENLENKAASRRAKYWEELNARGVWIGLNSPNQAEVQVALDKWRVASKELEDGIKKDAESAQKKSATSARADAQSVKIVHEAQGKALAAQAEFLGDKWGQKEVQAAADYQKALDGLEARLVGYKGVEKDLVERSIRFWAEYEFGVKKAQIAYDKWAESMKFWGESESRIGQLSFDPGRQYGGQLDSMQAERAAALKAAGDDQARIAAVNEEFALREIDLREKTLGELAALDGAYWLRRQEGLARQDVFLRSQGVNEHARAVFMAQERDKLEKAKLESRMGYEESFGSYLSDRLALNYGLYKDAATRTIETWQKMADAIIKGIDGISDAFSWTFGQVMGDLITGKLKSVGNYTEQLMAQLKQAFASFITDLAKIAMQRYIVVPIIGQIMGTEGSFGLEGVSGLGTKGGDGASLGSLSKYAGYGKDAYSLMNGGGSWVSGLNNWGASTLGIGVTAPIESIAGGAPIAAVEAAQSMGVTGSAVTGGLGSMAAAGGAGAAVGGLAGQFMRPDNPSSSYVGSGVGLGAGALAAYMGAGSWAGPIGMAAALVAAAVTAAVTPPTKTSTWSVPNASQPAMFVAGGDILPASYGVIKTTTSGMFGSTEESRKTIFGLANPEMAAKQEASWKAANAGLDTFTKAVGVSADALKQAKSSFSYPAIPIPEGYEADVYRNVANAQAEHVLTQIGMIAAIKGAAREGEVYIDTLGRLGSAFAAMENIGIATGFRLEDLARGMDRIAATDYASRLMEAAGGADALAAALGRLSAYGYTGQERFERGLTATAEATGRAIAGIGDMTVTIENFWARFREATERGLDPANVQAWVIASSRMEQWEKATEQARAQATQTQTQALQQNIAVMQQQISVVQQASQAWRQFSDQMVRLKASLLMDKALSPLSPLEKMNAAKARLGSLTAEANSRSTEHLADIDQATKDYLTSALEYYGATADYYAIFNSTSATIDQLQSLSEVQVSEAAQQIAALNIQIEQNNAQLAALNNINAGIGGMVNAVNNMQASIGSAVQAANAAQQSASVPQWAAVAAPVDAVAAASPFLPPMTDDGSGMTDAYRALLGLGGVNADDVPRYASGGTTSGGWFVAGDDPSRPGSGELLHSTGPVRVYSNRESRAMLTPDNSGLEARLDQVVRVLDTQGRVLTDIAAILADGGGAGQKIDDLRRVMRGANLAKAGQ
jgi:tape measure domain-containing protein